MSIKEFKKGIESLYGESIDNVNDTIDLHMKLVQNGIHSEVIQGWKISSNVESRAVLSLKVSYNCKIYHVLLFEGVHVSSSKNIILKNRPSEGHLKRAKKQRIKKISK